MHQTLQLRDNFFSTHNDYSHFDYFYGTKKSYVMHDYVMHDAIHEGAPVSVMSHPENIPGWPGKSVPWSSHPPQSCEYVPFALKSLPLTRTTGVGDASVSTKPFSRSSLETHSYRHMSHQ